MSKKTTWDCTWQGHLTRRTPCCGRPSVHCDMSQFIRLQMARRLDLHASALSDSEYSLYTSILSDITLSNDPDIPHDDAYYNQQTVGVREARAWLRGRYSHVPASNIDLVRVVCFAHSICCLTSAQILKFFSPTLAQTDYLSGGQFFAALRLVVHAESGKNVDRALAFVQG